MNVSQMKFSTKVARLAELKAAMESVKADFEELRDSVINELKESGLKSAEFNGVKVTFKAATYYSYTPEAVGFLKSKGLNNCVKEEVVTDSVKACLKAGVLNETELNEYRKASVRESLTVSVK